MEAQKSESATKPSTSAPAAAATSCRKKKSEEAAFLEDIKDHIDEFMFGLSRKVAEKEKNAEQQEIQYGTAHSLEWRCMVFFACSMITTLV
uniref:Uncharacterized protein n=1 Tax=Chenopodium quinoa TaxID=63459 RepID=A0A803MF26_CHEQI